MNSLRSPDPAVAARGQTTPLVGTAPGEDGGAVGPARGCDRDGPPPSPPAPADLPGNCASLPGHQFLTCLGRPAGDESWVVALPDGRTRLARLIHTRGRLDLIQAREAAARLTSLTHPALLRLEAVHVDPGRVILITELPGTSLRDRLEECRGQRLAGVPRPELVACLREVGEILDRLRAEYGMQHLALHPGAVLFGRGGVRLMDFGLAGLFWLPAGRGVGEVSARYAAPELFEGEVSSSCDQYSLALIYQELLTGLHPGRHRARPRTAADRPRRQPDLDLVPAPDRAVLARALHHDPRRRFAGCAELVRALDEAARRRQREAIPPLAALPAVIAWPGPEPGPTLRSAGRTPPLELLLPGLVARAAGGVQVQEYHGIRYLLHPGRALLHRCAAWLPAGVAQLKLTAFAEQWGAEIVHGDARAFVCRADLPAALWQRCLGRQVGLEVCVRLKQPPAPVAKLTEVHVEMRPQGATKAQRAQLLWEVGPRLLESLRLHLQARPEQRHQPRLLCQERVQVSPVRPSLELAAPLECQGKDISPTGIGFFLPDQPPGGQVYLRLGDGPPAEALGVRAKIVRVQPCGDGWYEVGAAFPVGANAGR